MKKVIRKLGIMAAMDEEFKLLTHSYGCKVAQSIGPRSFYSSSSQGLELALAVARIGKVASAVTTSLLINEFKVDAILFVGVAGAIDPAVAIGDIVVADRLVQHDIDLKGVLGYQRFDIPLLNVREMRCCGDLVSLAERAARRAVASNEYRVGVGEFCSHEPRAHVGMIGSGDEFICETKKREGLREVLPDLKCVEMEGAAVAQVCVEHEVPFVVVRTISDAASHTAPVDFKAFVARAASVGSESFATEFVRALAERGSQPPIV